MLHLLRVIGHPNLYLSRSEREHTFPQTSTKNESWRQAALDIGLGTSQGLQSRGWSTVALEGLISGRRGRMRRGGGSRSAGYRRRMDEVSPHWESKCHHKRMEAGSGRRVLCQHEAFGETYRSQTGGIVLSSRAEGSGPCLRVEIKFERVRVSQV